ncbi:MAG: AIR synthase related protein [Promethearchaeota archaeon]
MSENDKLYSRLGVSSNKEEVHKAIEKLDKGLFPGAFCKIVEDVNDRPEYCSIFHSDGAGSKSSLAYMYYKETGDISPFRGVVRDAIVMNIDDILCVGATGPVFLSNNLGRNSKYISGDIIATIIEEYNEYCGKLTSLGLKTIMCGGETADIGDIIKTIIIDASVFVSMKRKNVINANNIQSSDIIIGLASDGKASYEEEYNSGIGSNGLTLARHGTLNHKYYHKYPECYDSLIEEKSVFFGIHNLKEKVKGIGLTVGEALLSPTRTYTPIILEIVKEYGNDVHGIIHNTGGGQTKNLHYGKGIHYLKNNLFKIPIIFEIIQNSSKTKWKEMYSVFNMGHRLELYCNESIANEIMKISKKYDVNAKIIGQCEKSSLKNKNMITIKSDRGDFEYP